MKNTRNTLLPGIARRLKQLRSQLNYSYQQMAAKLGVDHATYYRNENGETIPGLTSMYLLHKDFNISIDWLLFDTGSMYVKEKTVKTQEAKDEETKFPVLEGVAPEVRELLDCMEQDAVVRHEILLCFHKYKEKKDRQDKELDIEETITDPGE